MKNALILFLMVVGLQTSASGQQGKTSTPKPVTVDVYSNQPRLLNGDIIFQALPCGSLCDAIIATTPCAEGRRFNHCGIVRIVDGKTTVIEAIGSKVQETELQQFLDREGADSVAFASFKSMDSKKAAAGVNRALGYLGRPYDDAFVPGDSALYCSELVYESFRQPGTGNPLFSLQPMTFKAAPDQQFHSGWQQYYRTLGAPIPEGLPGINPCAIAASGLVEFRRIPKSVLLLQ